MVRACIFDLGGTIVDKYSLIPFKSFKNAFKKHNINVNNNLIINDMGIDKKKHIKNIINDKYVMTDWRQNYKRHPSNNDINNIYNDFKYNTDTLAKNIDIIPETKYIIHYLKENDILVGTTTGFGKNTTDIISDVLKKNNVFIDNFISSDCVPKNTLRPNSGMIYKNLSDFNININDRIIKIDDTNTGIIEGKRAGCITVGVSRWSIYMNAFPNVPFLQSDINKKLLESRKKLEQSNPDYIIDTLDQLIPIINWNRYF